MLLLVRINHLGHKLYMPCRTCNVTVMHSRKLIDATVGCPDAWNDNTIILHYEFSRGIHEDTLFKNNEFTLFEHDTLGGMVKVEHYGV